MTYLTRVGSSCATLLLAMAASLPAQNTVLSAPMLMFHEKPYVQVMLNGKGPFRFVIDTGTGGQAMVTPQLADELGLPGAGETRLNDPSGQGGKRVPVVLIQSLQVAGVQFAKVRAIRHALTSEDGFCQGMLGFTLFRDYLMTLDYPDHELRLMTGSLFPDHERTVFPLRIADGIPIVRMQIEGRLIDAQIDSGGDGLSLPEQFVRPLKFAIKPADFAEAQSFATRFEVKVARLAEDVRLGDYTFTQPFVEVHGAFPLANFGSCPMQNFEVTFDQKHLLVRLLSSKQRIVLNATPTAVRLVNAPSDKPSASGLVPVG
jgi:predicted aspartyl protease